MTLYSKLIAILLAVLTCLTTHSQNNIMIDKNIKIFLRDYLKNRDQRTIKVGSLDIGQLSNIGNRDTVKYAQIDMLIWDLLSDTTIQTDSDMNETGIYGFRNLSSPLTTFVLMKHHDTYEILQMTEGDQRGACDFSTILDDLQSYFARHPDIDHRLLPLYNKAILDVYILNTQADELGPWFDWYKTEQWKFIIQNNNSD